MKAKELIEIMKSGKKPIVKLTGELWDESWGQKGMIAEITKYNFKHNEYDITFDFNRYKDHNLAFQPHGYYLKTISGEAKETGTAFEAGMMKIEDIKEDVMFSEDFELPFKILDDNGIISEYLERGSKLSYVEWLEKELIKTRTELEETY